MGRYAFVLFDLDGTLTDSGPGIMRSVQYSLRRLGIEVEDLQQLRPFVGPPLWASYPRHYGFDETTTRRAVELYREYYRERGIFENSVFTGVPQLLAELAATHTLAVATTKPTPFAEQVLRHFQLAHHFSAIVGSELDGARSDKAELIAETLGRLGVKDRSQVVMIGDREHDMIGAHHQHIDSIGVTYGYGSEDELIASRPTALARTPQEVRAFITGEGF